MPPPGRRPRPTHLKLLEGNPGKRPINEDEPEPEVPAKVPRAPAFLGKEGKAEWRKLVPELMELGLYTSIDRPALTAYCEAWDTWRQAEDHKRKHGVTTTTPNGYEVQSAYVGIANKAMAHVRAFLAEFGMSPSSRSRVGVKPKSKDDTEEFLFGKRRRGS